MIKLQMLNDQYIYLNPDFMEVVEAGAENNKHNTIVKIHDGTSYVVQESPDEIVRSIEEWRRRCRQPAMDSGPGSTGRLNDNGEV
jgi:uncharacterized protein YlzI (FlbEa/FlbD family)